MKRVSPKPELYEVLNDKQLSYLVNCLDARHEIPLQYEYIGNGAHVWDTYAQRLMDEKSLNTINSSPWLLAKNYSYLDSLVAKYSKVNIIDVTIGNVMPARDFLGHLLDIKKDVSYIGLDYSREILKIAEKNIAKWFNSSVHFQGYEVDLNFDHFNDILEKYTIDTRRADTVNLVLFLGGTHHNFTFIDSCYRIIYESLGKNDFLITASKLDSATSRKFFDFHPEISNKDTPITPTQVATLDTANLDLLNIDSSMYEIEYGFDGDLFQRYIRARLHCDVTAVFELSSGKRSVIFRKDETILLARIWHQTRQDMLSLLDRTGFHMLHTSHTPDAQYLLTISRIKRS